MVDEDIWIPIEDLVEPPLVENVESLVEDLPTPPLVEEHVMPPIAQPNVEPPTPQLNVKPPIQQSDRSDVPPIDGDYDMEEGPLEEFSDPEYEQEEDVAADYSDEDVFFKLTEPLDIGDENLMVENQGNAGGEDGNETDYDDSHDLRSITSEFEEGGSSLRARDDIGLTLTLTCKIQSCR